MRGIRRKVAVGTLAIGASAGLIMVGAAPALAGSAEGGSSALYCTPSTTPTGQSIMDCAVGAYYYPGLRHVRANQIGSGNTYKAGSNIPCPAGGVSNPYGYTDLRWATTSDAPGTKYKVTVVDCYGDKDLYRVDQAGNVTLIRSTFALS